LIEIDYSGTISVFGNGKASTGNKAMTTSRNIILVLCVFLLAMSAAIAGTTTPKEIKVISSAGGPDPVGDVIVTWEGGRHERLTHGAHAEQAKLGPDDLIGWAWSKERYKNLWVNEHLRVQRGKHLLFEIKSGKPFIEDWAFAKEGVVVKSRAMHGPALIELFSLSDGKQIENITKAFGPEVPLWAKPFADSD
jgi:hypothetical protein